MEGGIDKKVGESVEKGKEKYRKTPTTAEEIEKLKATAITQAVTVQQAMAAQQSTPTNPTVKSQMSPEHQAKLDAVKNKNPTPPTPSRSPSVNPPSPS
jgi:hypothetical protein